jgi:hypothetical protein
MKASDIPRAVEAAVAVASATGLTVDDATVIHRSNRIAVRLMPCDVLARVAYAIDSLPAEFEVEVAQHLAETSSPVGALDPRIEPRVQMRDGSAATLWTYYESLPSQTGSRDYAQALLRLHAGMRHVVMPAPHFTDRVAEARSLLDDRARTPELGDADRELLGWTLQSMLDRC